MVEDAGSSSSLAELVLARRAYHEAEACTWVGIALETRHCSKSGSCSVFAFDFQDRPVEPEQTLPRPHLQPLFALRWLCWLLQQLESPRLLLCHWGASPARVIDVLANEGICIWHLGQLLSLRSGGQGPALTDGSLSLLLVVREEGWVSSSSSWPGSWRGLPGRPQVFVTLCLWVSALP